MRRETEPQGCLSIIFRVFGIGGRAPAQFPYQRKDYLLSKGERAFFSALQTAVGNDYLIFSKVRLADLIFVRRGTEGRQAHFNRIQSKHIDFVLCDHDVVRPILAIELDDASHDREDRQDRDGFVDSALDAAGLPILHVRAKMTYDVRELRSSIDERVRVG